MEESKDSLQLGVWNFVWTYAVKIFCTEHILFVNSYKYDDDFLVISGYQM